MQLISHQALARYMEHREISVRQLAARVGADKSTIGHLRSGFRRNCDPDLAKAIAKALDVPLDAFFVTKVSHVARDVRRSA